MAIMLTKNYQKISTIYLTYGELRTYAKYIAQNKETNKTYIAMQARYYVYSGSVSFDSWSLKFKVGSNSAQNNSGGYTTLYSGETTLFSISDELNHQTDGSSIECGILTTWNASYGGSGTVNVGVTVPKIDRYPMIQTATDFNDEENPKVTYSTIMGFENATLYGCISVDGTTDTVPYRQLNVEEGEYTFNLTTAERNSLRNATPNSITLPVTFILKTTVGNDNYYSTLQKNMTIVNAEPTFTYSETELNQNVINLLGSSSASTIIQNASQVQITISPTAYKGATISSVRLTHSGEVETKTSSPYTFTKNIKSAVFSVVVNDSRTNGTSDLISHTMLEYSEVKILSYSFKRQSQTSSNIIFNGEFSYWGNIGSYANTPVVKYKLDDGSWVTIPSANYTIDSANHKLTITNYTISNVLAYTLQGQFSISINDILTSKVDTSDNGKVLKGVPTFDYGEHDLKVNGTLYVADQNGENKKSILDLTYPVGSIYTSTSSTSPATLFGGTWTQITTKFGDEISGTLVSSSYKNSWTNNYSVDLTPGTYLIVSSTQSAGNGKNITLRYGNATGLRQSYYHSDANTYSAQLIQFVTVTSNTTVYLQTWCASSGTFSSGAIFMKAYKLYGNLNGYYSWERTA